MGLDQGPQGVGHRSRVDPGAPAARATRPRPAHDAVADRLLERARERVQELIDRLVALLVAHVPQRVEVEEEGRGGRALQPGDELAVEGAGERVAQPRSGAHVGTHAGRKGGRGTGARSVPGGVVATPSVSRVCQASLPTSRSGARRCRSTIGARATARARPMCHRAAWRRSGAPTAAGLAPSLVRGPLGVREELGRLVGVEPDAGQGDRPAEPSASRRRGPRGSAVQGEEAGQDGRVLVGTGRAGVVQERVADRIEPRVLLAEELGQVALDPGDQPERPGHVVPAGDRAVDHGQVVGGQGPQRVEERARRLVAGADALLDQPPGLELLARPAEGDRVRQRVVPTFELADRLVTPAG